MFLLNMIRSILLETLPFDDDEKVKVEEGNQNCYTLIQNNQDGDGAVNGLLLLLFILS